ncbi:MAG: outer membrane beta-barrel protein [Sediminibacterium sp.]|nr:outer membrane beta-barrel protein [Sediminibacterium sp.]
MDQEFDDIIKTKLADHSAKVPEGLWDNIKTHIDPSADAAFDGFTKHSLVNYSTTTPSHLWDNISTAIIPEETKHFDSFIQERLSDYIAPVPADMWDKVKPEEEEDKRRFFFLLPRAWMVAASILLLVLAGTVSAYLYYQRINEVSTESQHEKELESNKNDNENITPPSNTNNKPTGSATQQDVENNKESTSLTANTVANYKDPNTNQINSLDLYKSFYNKYPETRQSIQSKALDNSQEQLIISNDPSVSSTSFDDEGYANNREKGTYYFQYKKGLNAFRERTINDNNHTSGIKNVVICPSDRKSINPDWDLEVFTGPNYGMKSVTANTASPAYLAKKDSSEKAGIGITAGFNIVKPLNDRLLLKTGLQYTQLNEKFTYRTENEVRTTTVVSVRTIIRAPGDTVIVRDTSTLQQVGFKNNTVKNRYRSIDIPVIMGYRFGNDDLSIGLNAGVIVNISSWYQGVILDTSLTAIPITKTGISNTYKSNIGLGLYGSISIAKKINYNSYIFAEPFVRYNLNNTTTNSAPVNQRFIIGGLAVGLRFNLNSR